MTKLPDGEPIEKMTILMDHYHAWTEDNDTRRLRKNGWNDCLNGYQSKLPANWPYTSRVTDPRIHNSINEKTARLLNTKLRGRLEPREGGDMIGAKINNSILDYQWDAADTGGSMLEKIAKSDQITRIIGLATVLNYWDADRNTNEIKCIDPRDIGFDGAADHVKNARWVQVREWATISDLEKRGYDLSNLESSAKAGQTRSIAYESQVKENLGLEDRTGDDLANPVMEVVTEYIPSWASDYEKGEKSVFLPEYNMILEDGEGDYKHGKVPVNQLRYYPLPDEIHGESEIVPVLPLQRAINAFLCSTIDTMNINNRPPIKVISGQVRMETIEYGPSAIWIQNSQGAIEEHRGGDQSIKNFNTIYPALVAALNSAMGDQSLGVSNIGGGGFDKKTATEVKNVAAQQNNRDQYNQLYLSQFLEDIMTMWLSNNKQYLFDDETKHYVIFKIIGRDRIDEFQRLKLDQTDIPPEAMNELEQAIMTNPASVTDEVLQGVSNDLALPTNPVVTNPNELPEAYDLKSKLDIKNPNEADLYVTPEDMEGEYDYIPDVKSMAAGALRMAEEGRKQAFALALNPAVTQLLAAEGQKLKVSELLINMLEDAGFKEAESLFEESQPPAGAVGPGQAAPGVLPTDNGAPGQPVVPGVPQAAANAPGQGQISEATRL